MRDPWFPLLAILIVLLGTWLGIFGPMPRGFTEWLQGWQTLIAASVALGAAYIAFRNTNRSLAHAEQLEKHRRQRKQAALRAMLPLALAQITEYAYQTAQSLSALISKCDGEVLPFGTLKDDFVIPLPSDTLKSVTEFMEYSDSVNVNVFASTVALIQIHDSRLRAMVSDNQDTDRSRMILRSNLERGIVDAASIYAGAASGFNYARRRSDHLPGELELLWDSVFSALRDIGFWEEEHPRLHELVTRTQDRRGPFDRSR